jgi:hypothetical protein
MARSKPRRAAAPSRRRTPVDAKARSPRKTRAKAVKKEARRPKKLRRADHKAIRKAIKKFVKKAVKKAMRKALKKVAKTAAPPRKVARLNRPRRVLPEALPTPPSSLNLDQHPSAARSGRAQAEHRAAAAAMSGAITGGDRDVNVEDAYFTGDEAPGGDNPSPDQDVVDEIGKALGVEYQDAEELRGADKLTDRDKHRWELDPASSEDYRNRNKE